MQFTLAFGALALVIAAQASAPPTFPTSWQAQTVDGIAIFQGGIKKPDGETLCLSLFCVG